MSKQITAAELAEIVRRMTMGIKHTKRIQLCGSSWYYEAWRCEDNNPYTVTVTRANPTVLWVVQYRNTPNVWFVVDGTIGQFGEEPVVTGPFDDMDAAAFAAISLSYE